MNSHPRLESLQDYFENALAPDLEARIRDHLLDCDHCTGVLADFVAIESRVKQLQKAQIPDASRTKTLREATRILAEKRKSLEDRRAAQELSHLQLERLRNYFKEWKVFLYPELRAPALQVCSLSFVLVTFVAIQKRSSRTELTYEPLSREVRVLLSEDPTPKEKK